MYKHGHDAMAAQVGMVFQNGALFDSLSVGENVGFLLYEHTRLPASRIQVLQSCDPVSATQHMYSRGL